MSKSWEQAANSHVLLVLGTVLFAVGHRDVFQKAIRLLYAEKKYLLADPHRRQHTTQPHLPCLLVKNRELYNPLAPHPIQTLLTLFPV